MAGLAKRLRCRDGFTLPELLIGMTIGLVVLGGAVTVFSAGVHSQSSISSRSLQIQQARTTADRIVRELHQGASVSSATATSLTFITYVHSATCGGAASATATAIPCRVTYTCTAGSCTRLVRNTNGTGSAPASTVAAGLASSSVFSYLPSSTSPRYVGVNFTFAPQSGQNGVTVNDGAALGNAPS